MNRRSLDEDRRFCAFWIRITMCEFDYGIRITRDFSQTYAFSKPVFAQLGIFRRLMRFRSRYSHNSGSPADLCVFELDIYITSNRHRQIRSEKGTEYNIERARELLSETDVTRSEEHTS